VHRFRPNTILLLKFMTANSYKILNRWACSGGGVIPLTTERNDIYGNAVSLSAALP
jgi:hypothetical protein